MLNVDALSKTLTAMPLPQLQQYAAMHKNDPYVVSLALSIANQKKQMQVAQDGAAGQQQQPKVADQAIAGMAPQAPAQHMLPEEQGIGALPAPNIQHMAEGGIIGNEGEEQQAGAFDFRSENEPVVRMAGGGMVSFAGGGDVPRFNGQYGSVPSSNAGMDPMYSVPGMQTGTLYADALRKAKEGRPLSDVEKALLFASKPFAAAADVAALPFTGLQNLVRNPLDSSTPPSMTPASDARTRALYGEQQAANTPAQLQGGTNLFADKAIPGNYASLGKQTPPTSSPLADLISTQQRQNAPVAPAAPAAPAASSYIDRFKKEMGQQETGPNKEEFMKERSAISEDTYADIAKKLAENTAKMKSDKDESAYMAMIKGGLAMAGGSSPYALTNIAKGLESGAADYSEALKEFRKATTEQSKMEIELARAKAAEKRGDMDAYQKAMEKVGDRNAQRDDRQAAGVAALLGGEMTAKSAANVAGIHAAATAASANAPRNLMEALGSAKPDSDLMRGFNMQTLKAHAASLQEQWGKQAYPTGNMGEPNAAFLSRYRTPQKYISENIEAMNNVASGGFSTDVPPNATVLNKKKGP